MEAKRPQMILFDYGHTLVHEISFDHDAGCAAVLKHAVENPNHVTPAQLRQMYDIWREPMNRAVVDAEYEVPALLYDRAIYDACGLVFDCSYEQLEIEQWDAAIPCEAMPGIGELLRKITQMGIRTGVISNLSFSEESLKKRILGVIPDAPFEFYIASSSYGFRKPSGILFQIACQKAKLPAQEMFFCGDNTRADVYGAHEAGMTPVWYATDIPCFYRPAELDVEPHFPHLRVRHWDELSALLQTL